MGFFNLLREKKQIIEEQPTAELIISDLEFEICDEQRGTICEDETRLEDQPKYLPKLSAFDAIGNVEAVCPYCHESLKKKPARKTKCPHCGSYIYSRTRPQDKQKVLVTEEQGGFIDALYGVGFGAADFSCPENEFMQTKEQLAKKFGSEPSDRDVTWSLLSKQAIKSAERRDGMEYTGTVWKRAMILWGESFQDHSNNKAIEAIRQLSHVVYLEMNGPGIGDDDILWFHQADGYKNPDVLNALLMIIERTSMPLDEVEGVFINTAQRVQRTMKLSVLPEQAWEQINEDILDSMNR